SLSLSLSLSLLLSHTLSRVHLRSRVLRRNHRIKTRSRARYAVTAEAEFPRRRGCCSTISSCLRSRFSLSFVLSLCSLTLTSILSLPRSPLCSFHDRVRESPNSEYLLSFRLDA
ncbi:hypothetical protein TSAR_013437, partial [Trichomalopsis sarcophagae]